MNERHGTQRGEAECCRDSGTNHTQLHVREAHVQVKRVCSDSHEYHHPQERSHDVLDLVKSPNRLKEDHGRNAQQKHLEKCASQPRHPATCEAQMSHA